MGWGNDSCRVWFDVTAGPLTFSSSVSFALAMCFLFGESRSALNSSAHPGGGVAGSGAERWLGL